MTGEQVYTASCTNTVTPDLAELTFSVAGTAPATVNAGDKVTLSNQTWTVTVPGTVLDTGIGLSLLKFGDVVNGTVTPSLFATNTAEGVVAPGPVSVGIGPIENDGTGKAKPASATFSVADATWTSVGGTVGYSMNTADVLVEIGPLEVGFSCTSTSGEVVVETEVLGSTGIPPAGRPTPVDPPVVVEVTVTETVSTTSEDELPRTGAAILAPILLALGLIDMGYLTITAAAPARRRRGLG